MPKKKSPQQEERLPLDIFPEPIEPEIKVKPPTHRVWTENKAKLIERYLLYFVFITHHGTYIDGFAGPQDPQKAWFLGCEAGIGKRAEMAKTLPSVRDQKEEDQDAQRTEAPPA